MDTLYNGKVNCSLALEVSVHEKTLRGRGHVDGVLKLQS